MLTGPEGNSNTSVIDETFYNEIPDCVQLFRTPQIPINSASKLQFYKKVLGRDLKSELWAKEVEALGEKILIEQKIDLIFVTMSPFQCAKSAAALSKKFNVPWVADLRDPWALDETRVYTSSVHRFLDICKMRKDLKSADMIIMNTPEAQKCVREKFGWHNKNIRSLTNGFDVEDFISQKDHTRNEKFTIVHTGGLHTKTGLEIIQKKGLYFLLGKLDINVEILTRSHYYLIKSLEQLVEKRPDLASMIKVIFAGKANDADLEIATLSKISNCIEFRNYVSHNESVDMLLGADLLFLPMHDLPDWRRSTIVPGKTYEYMAAGKPILAAVPNGDAKDFLAECGTALICGPKNTEEMQEKIEKSFDSWVKNITPQQKQESYVCLFSRKHLTEKLSSLFDEMIA